MLVYNFAAMKLFSSKQYFYLSLLLACRIMESNSAPPELKDCLCQCRSAGLSRLARGGRPFCILIKAVRKKMWLSKFFPGASSAPLNRQAPVLQETSEDLFILKARSFPRAGGGCWGRLRARTPTRRGSSGFTSRTLSSAPLHTSLHLFFLWPRISSQTSWRLR